MTEALAIRWGILKFYHYLYGVRFTLVTDHQPLTQIFNSKKRLPQLSATRMLHYATELRLFNFDIKYRKSILHGNADCLSRLPMKSEELDSPDQLDSVTMYQLQQLEVLPITARDIARATRQDTEILPILENLRQGKHLWYELKFSL